MQHSNQRQPPHRWPSDLPTVLLVGAGVVGRAIAEAHAARNVSFCLADQSEEAITGALQQFSRPGIAVRRSELPIDGLSTIVVSTDQPDPQVPPASAHNLIVIESIIEQADAKRRLFAEIQNHFGGEAILCSNTSTLQIDAIATEDLPSPSRVCGMHFFMPVHARPAVEVVSGSQSDTEAIDAAIAHAARIGKRAIQCHDGPGFIVNRMLSPYLNQALLLLSRGATERQIERAALAYGMPMSPLELIDWIGASTMYHAGKAFMNAFPNRIEPSPIVPALLKRKRLGRQSGHGLYDYNNGQRSPMLAAEANQLIETYRTDQRQFSDGDVLLLLVIPMWIEARCLLEEGIADSMATVDLALAGGLGFTGESSWSRFFEDLGGERIDQAIQSWGADFRAMRSPELHGHGNGPV